VPFATRQPSRHRQRPDPLEHRPKQAAGQVTLRQRKPVIPRVPDQASHLRWGIRLRRLNAAERQLKSLPDAASLPAYGVFLNLQALRAALAPELLRSPN
jgi:hypothetical protein